MNSINKLHISLIVLLSIFSGLAGVWLYQIQKPNKLAIPEGLESTVLDKAFPITEFNLIDHNNNEFSQKNLKNKWTFIFFGFTNCPDVCPTTLLTMQQVWKKLASVQQNTSQQKQLLLVSVDPKRDTVDKLKPYIEYYNPEFIGITGSLLEITKLTKRLGVLYEYDNHGKSDGSYTVDHSTQIYLIDPTANLRAIFSAPHNAKSISENYLKIINFYASKL